MTGMETVVVRLFNASARGRTLRHPTPASWRSSPPPSRANRPLEIYGDGEQTRTSSSSPDIAEGLELRGREAGQRKPR